jgi:hypothetical protein
MKNGIVRELVKKTAAGALALAMIMSGMCFMSAGIDKVEAAGGFVTEDFSDISGYRGTTKTAPKPTKAGYKNYIFAGWFTDDTCATAYTGENGAAVAKFVAPQVLSAACQVTTGTEVSSEKSDLRLVSTVDGLKYARVGFDITINSKTKSLDSTTVYSSIKSTVDGLAYTDTPSVFNSASAYFITLKVTNIPKASFNTGILVTPYWVTLDGTKVTGITRYARVEDSYLKIVNVPVRLYNNQNVAAGYLEVSIPDGCTYVNYDKGIFEEMEVAVSGDKVKIVGNVEDISADTKADGLYANLRFSLTDVTNKPADSAFTITNPDFCDISETTQKLNVVEAAYNDFK